MRIRVVDVLELLANGLSPEAVVAELPDLEIADVHACLRFASQRVDHPVLAVTLADAIDLLEGGERLVEISCRR
jgi:hypothetical protein